MMTDILLTRHEVMDLLLKAGALRRGHFSLPTGHHADHFIQMPLALRYYRLAKVLCVGLSRLFRGCREVASALPHCSVIAPPSGGIPVAFGVGEALQAEQILWVERSERRYKFHQYMEVKPGDKCILVDDVLRTGQTLRDMTDLVQCSGGEIIAVGVLVDQRMAESEIGDFPLYRVVEIETQYSRPEECALCRAQVSLSEVHDWI